MSFKMNLSPQANTCCSTRMAISTKRSRSSVIDFSSRSSSSCLTWMSSRARLASCVSVIICGVNHNQKNTLREIPIKKDSLSSWKCLIYSSPSRPNYSFPELDYIKSILSVDLGHVNSYSILSPNPKEGVSILKSILKNTIWWLLRWEWL